MNKVYSLLAVALSTVMIAAVGLYCYIFHDGLSLNSSDWGNFGGYFNGLLAPILTVVNIFVFVSISMKLSSLDDKRADREEQGQRNLMLMQFRKEEIDTFNKIMDDAIVPYSQFAMSKDVLARPIVLADLYLHTFLKSKLGLFDLDDNSEITHSIYELKKELGNYHSKFVSDKDFGKKDIVGILELHSDIIRNLQRITLDI